MQFHCLRGFSDIDIINFQYMLPKKTGFAPFAQLSVGAMILFYAMNYGKMGK